ncbi:MAG TPA: hypothetical protein VKG24_21850, partial [Pseudolabrys sp.]|nr:hypothetical protein [Pseudolabrys sp.]
PPGARLRHSFWLGRVGAIRRTLTLHLFCLVLVVIAEFPQGLPCWTALGQPGPRMEQPGEFK